MHTVTATEASRSFAALLDEAERGETVVVTRGGRRVAMIGPASASNGDDFLTLFEASRVDAGFADDVASSRLTVTYEGPEWADD
jgi:prevent-host-death family protein